MRVHSKHYTFYSNGHLNNRYSALQDYSHSYIISLHLLNVMYSTALWNISTIFPISWYSIDRIRLHNIFKLASLSLQYAFKFALYHSMPHSSFLLFIWVMFFFLLHFLLPTVGHMGLLHNLETVYITAINIYVSLCLVMRFLKIFW